MRKITLYLSLLAYLASFVFSFANANEVNIFSARHYDSDVQLYQKFTDKTGIKVNVVSGKSGALEKRIIEEIINNIIEILVKEMPQTSEGV